jgi:thermitase
MVDVIGRELPDTGVASRPEPALKLDAVAGGEQSDELSRLSREEAVHLAALRDARDRREALAAEAGRDSRRTAFDFLSVPHGLGLVARGELLVLDTGAPGVGAVLRQSGFGFVDRVGRLRRYRRSGAAATELLDVAARLTALGARAAPNYITVAGHTIKSGLGLGGPRSTDVDPGRRPAGDRRGAGVRVAVLDTGIDVADIFADHDWLAGVTTDTPATPAMDTRPPEPLDGAGGHGAFVAGLVRQTAPACDVTVVPVLEGDGLGTDFALSAALWRLAVSGPEHHVVNVSLSCAAPDGDVPLGTSCALDLFVRERPRTMIVAAAGNGGGQVAPWPASHPAVVAVAAVDADGAPTSYSNRGPWVDFGVSADGMVSTYSSGTDPAPNDSRDAHGSVYATWSGTSFAAPQVAGRLAVHLGEGLSPAEALAALRDGCPARPAVGHVLGSPHR